MMADENNTETGAAQPAAEAPGGPRRLPDLSVRGGGPPEPVLSGVPSLR